MASSNKSGKDCLFSAISGTITFNGIPVERAHVKRIAGKAHAQGEFTDVTYTDEKGYFSMPSIWERNLLSRVFPMEFAVPQGIVVTYNDQEYWIWVSTKFSREENSESLGKPLVVQCELTSDRRTFRVKGTPFNTLCTWDVEIDPPRVYGPPGSAS